MLARHSALAVIAGCWLAFPNLPGAHAAEKPVEKAPVPREVLVGFLRPAELTRADPKKFRANTAPAIPGFVGIEVGSDPRGRAVVLQVAALSPAEAAGLRPGDAVLEVAEEKVESAAALKNRLRAAAADEPLVFTIERAGKTLNRTATPRPISRPLAEASGSGRATLGVRTGEPKKDGRVEVLDVTPGGAAAAAGFKPGDVIVRIGDAALSAELAVRDVLSRRKPGDVVEVGVLRGEKEVELKATLGAEESSTAGRRGGWDDRLPRIWTKPSYRLAIVGIEYPDVKHNPKIEAADWSKAMFSLGSYTGKSATGQPVYGSMADYFRDSSYGRFAVEGDFLGWVEVSKKRTEYTTGYGTSSNEKTALLAETLDKYLARNGAKALDGYDGIFFLYAGARVNTTRGSLYWPHRASLRHGGKSWPYFIVQEGGDKMNDISVFCHEFGHMLGLPDLYAKPEVPGMEGVGPWCAMSQQNPGGRPQHYSAWSKAQLGWIDPVTVDPRVKQNVVLHPVTAGPTECVKVPVRADGSEYLLLENRARRGWDADLPGEGLLVWRVLPGNTVQRVFLEESHGIAGVGGPRQHMGSVPFPSPSNDSFTPFTTPSSSSRLGGGLDVSITSIRRLPDGRVTFQIGYDYQ
jgi:M6 family metalloprotease-like protein